MGKHRATTPPFQVLAKGGGDSGMAQGRASRRHPSPGKNSGIPKGVVASGLYSRTPMTNTGTQHIHLHRHTQEAHIHRDKCPYTHVHSHG